MLLRGRGSGEGAQGGRGQVRVVGQRGRDLGELLEPCGDPVARGPALGQLEGDVEEGLDHGRAVLALEHLEDAAEEVVAGELAVRDHLEAGDHGQGPVDRLGEVGGPVQQDPDGVGVGPHRGEGEVAGVEQVEVGLGRSTGCHGPAGLDRVTPSSVTPGSETSWSATR